MIKKIVISGKGNTNSSFRWWGIGLTIPVDGVWTDKWLTGSNVTVSTKTKYVCDEFEATTTLSCYNTSGYWLDSLFAEGVSKCMAFQTNSNFELTITFTEPITAIKNVLYRFYANGSKGSINGFKAYDENDTILYSNETKWTSNTSSSDYSVNSFETPDLETTKIYPTNKLGTVETTDVCHFENVYSIDVINPTYSVPNGTDLKFLLSFDGKNTYKAYDSSINGWITVDTDDIIAQGMSGDTLYALRSSEYLLAVDSTYRTLDILVGLITTDETRTPIINSIQVSYYKITT